MRASSSLLLVALAFAGNAGAAPEPPRTSPHAEQMASHPTAVHTVPPRGELPAPRRSKPNHVMYGYQPYWEDDLSTVPWTSLTHLAIFEASTDSNGNLGSTSNWDNAANAVAMAKPYGVHVDLCVAAFDGATIGAVVGNATARANLIANLKSWKQKTGADGVNIDFEGLQKANKADMVTFATELQAAVGEVVFAAPAVDWSGAWDYQQLTKHAYLFIMAYDYSWSGGNPGPVDPLYGTSTFGKYAIDWTINDYATHNADMTHVIVGLPLYGEVWPASSSATPGTATGKGSAVLWADAQANAATYGAKFDAASDTPWYWTGSKQGWYGNTDSLRDRVAYSFAQGAAGVGFWALHYDGNDPTVWKMLDEQTGASTTADTAVPQDTAAPQDTGTAGNAAYVADAGKPFLAYVGDSVQLSAAGSTGPDGVTLKYKWKQVAGPAVTLDDSTAKKPMFTVQAVGTTVFELRVGDGTTWSAPARSDVVVLDPGAGTEHKSGCDETSTPASLALAGVALLVTRRRRTA